jgi:hypothetical protein
VKDQVLEQLHRNRAAAAVEPALEHGQERDEVDAAVVEVPLVLDRDDRLLHHVGDLARPEHDRTAAIGLPAAVPPGHHDLRRRHEQPEMLRRKVPERLRFGRIACPGAKGQGEKERQDAADCAVHRFLDTRA